MQSDAEELRSNLVSTQMTFAFTLYCGPRILKIYVECEG